MAQPILGRTNDQDGWGIVVLNNTQQEHQGTPPADEVTGEAAGTLGRSSARRWRTNLITLVIGLAILLIDPFGFSKVSDTHASGLLNTLLGNWYDNTYQKKISVVIFDDQTVKDFADEWPARYSFHSNILEEIRTRFRPRALFIDILFLHPRKDESINTLLEVLRDYNPIPVFVATSGPTIWSRDGVRQEFLDLAKAGGHVHLVRVPRYVDITKVNAYPFVVDETGREPEDEYRRTVARSPRPSAAWALYQELCLHPSTEAPTWTCNEPRTTDPDRLRSNEFHVIWARGTLPSTRTMYQGCSEVGGLLDDLVAVFRGLEVIQDRCPYAETVSVSALMDPNWSEPLLADRRFAEGGPRIDLNDKVVLYGASLESFPDLISAPTHRRPLPGVYFHAMALDNLLSFGAHYKSDTSR